MRSFPSKVATVLLMAMALIMFGCGGGGGSSSTSPDDSDPKPTPLSGIDQFKVEQYQEEAKEAKEAAMVDANMARSKATMARAEATKAREAASMAKMARTDYAEADMKATEAEMAAMAAEAAATAAEAAATAAENAYMATKADDVTVETAKAERDKAKAEARIAMEKNSGDDGADAEYMAAKAAAMEAATAADMYTLELFKVASGQGMSDAEKKARITTVEGWIKNARGDTGNDQFGAAGAGASGARAFTVAPAGDGTGTQDNSISGQIQVDSDGNDLVAQVGGVWGAVVQHPIGKDRVYRFGTYTAELLRTPDPEATTEQATQRDLQSIGGFTGVELSKGTLHAHIYTDYDPSKRKAAIKAGNISGVLASSGRVSGTFDLSGTGITALAGSKFTVDGVTYMGTGVTFACAAPADCSYTSTGAAATATITSLGSGWRVTGTAAAVPEAGDPDYMTFGYWLNMADGAGNAERLGVFAGGNRFETSDTDTTTPLTGKATYRGSAAGLHGMTGAKQAVQPFDAKAELTADFDTLTDGTTPADALGSVKGKIYEINSGGTMLTGGMSQIILAPGNIDGATGRGFSNYHARMGTPKLDPAAGTATYPINGLWQGRLSLNAAENDDAAKRYPLSMTGTFGVSGTLDMGTASDMTDDVTHSLIGAFGTYLEE